MCHLSVRSKNCAAVIDLAIHGVLSLRYRGCKKKKLSVDSAVHEYALSEKRNCCHIGDATKVLLSSLDSHIPLLTPLFGVAAVAQIK